MTAITAGLAQSPTQAAIYAALVADSALSALVGARIYDAIPESTVSNYVAIGEWSEFSSDTLEDGNAGVGSELSVTICAYTDDAGASAGYKAVQAILNRVKIVLHGATLTIADWATVTCEHEETTVMRDEDQAGRPKRYGISTYSVLVEAL